MSFYPRGRKPFKTHKKWEKFPRTRYKSTAWRKDAWKFLAKKNRQHGGRFLHNALARVRANRHAKNMWSASFGAKKWPKAKFAPPGRARDAQADWRWRNRNM